jgi:hypothetical protein
MSLNKYKKHVLILPEDDANRQIANGFIQNITLDSHVIQILPPAGGWSHVLEKFESEHIREMRNYPMRNMVLVIDFDKDVDARTQRFKQRIPVDLSDRVFVIGTENNPESLKKILNMSLEQIGIALSQDCECNTTTTWNCDLLKNNLIELDRLYKLVRPFLFDEN